MGELKFEDKLREATYYNKNISMPSMNNHLKMGKYLNHSPKWIRSIDTKTIKSCLRKDNLTCLPS